MLIRKGKRLFTSFLMTLLSLGQLCAQYTSVHPSPNIGWNLVDLQQENNPYTGTTALKIPLYELQFGKNSLPVNLSYNTRAMQVDQLPSWVGLGWNLNIGGQVTRVVNGKPDELRETKQYSIITTTYNGPFTQTITTSEQVLTDHDFAYISNYGRLNNSNWASYDYTFNTLAQIPAAEQLPGQRIIIRDDDVHTEPVLTIDNTRNYDFEPDEFNFSVGNVSGKFYLNHNGEWKCEAPGGNFKVEVTAPAVNIKKGSVSIPRFIYQIIITGPDGTRYYFGGDASDKLKNVEFWRGPTGTGAGGFGPINIFNYYGNIYLDVVPDAWLLTKIETPDNYTVNFEYKKGKLQLQYADAPFGEGSNTLLVRNNPGSMFQSMAEPWYLTKVVCSNNTSIELQSQDSYQLNTDKTLKDISKYSTFTNYADIVNSLTEKNNLQKLTGLQVKNGSEVIKSFAFEYIENLSERLKLTALKEMSPNNQSATNRYSFVYNGGKLPEYGSGKVDHFGYYNNKRYFTDNTTLNYQITRADFEAQYYNSREPDFNYARYETLDKVYFPTGGYRKYEYEENDYSQAITRWPFGVTPAGGNLVTGGIRVHKISDYLQDGSLANETEFIYKTAINGTTSSGVLSIPRPKYTDNNLTGGYYFNTSSFTPFDRIQSHITYSTVFEKRRDGSYTKYVFSNYDNGSNDNQPMYETAGPAFWDAIPFVDNAFRRGAIKELTMYNNQGNPVKKTEYNYQDQYDDYSRLIRAVRIVRQTDLQTFRASACPQYYFPNVVRYEKEQMISAAGGSQIKETNYTYDGYNNQVEVKSNNSKGEEIKTLFRYPYNFNTGNANNPYKKMTDRYMVNYKVEQRNVLTRNGQELLTGGAINDYAEFGGPLYMPQATYELKIKQPVVANAVTSTWYDDANGRLSIDGLYGVIDHFNYDNRGHVLEKRPFAGPVENYQWTGNQRFPVVKLVSPQNSVPAGVKVYFSEGFEDNQSAAIDHPYSGRRYLSGDFQVPFTKPDARSYLVDYRYYANGAWQYMRKAFSDNMTLTEGDGIDEVRVFPANTQIYSYTFSALGGLTTETDLNGKTVFYEYDDFGRLSVVRDQDKNIVRTFCYNYLGDPVNCLPAYGNDDMSRVVYRNAPCSPGYVPWRMEFIMPSGVFVSFKSKDEANTQAVNYMDQNAQAYVDQHGPCVQVVYARLEYDNQREVVIEEIPIERKLVESRADLVIRLYSDEACTQPAYASDATLQVHIDPQAFVYNDNGAEEMYAQLDDKYALVAENVTVTRTDLWWDPNAQTWTPLATWKMNPYIRPSEVPFVIVK